MSQRVIRISDLARRPGHPGMLGVSAATIWRWVREGRFPAPFKMGPATTVWDAEKVEAFLARQAEATAK